MIQFIMWTSLMFILMLGNGFQCLPSMYQKEDTASKKIFLLNDMSSDHVTEKSKEKTVKPHVEYDDDVPASSLSNNRTDDDVKQLVQNMINRRKGHEGSPN
uniref:Uncharacterized protein n=1 Tax=Biomphalaria glabrata TaxID=6526 RepID=A0A2C9LNC2_BIOGL